MREGSGGLSWLWRGVVVKGNREKEKPPEGLWGWGVSLIFIFLEGYSTVARDKGDVWMQEAGATEIADS